jgi:hypothetical protein
MPQSYPNGELVIVIDCADLDRSARFWAAVLGYQADGFTSGLYRSLAPVSGVGTPTGTPVGSRAPVTGSEALTAGPTAHRRASP